MAIIRFGSLTARLLSEQQSLAEDVARIFGTSLKPLSRELAASVDADIAFSAVSPGQRSERPRIPNDGMIVHQGYPRSEVHTEALSAVLDVAAAPVRADIVVLQPHLPHFDLCVHLAVVFHKLLFLLNRVVLHAAAVRFGERVNLFLGDKGAGKSTTALRLARAGGTVLGEDHVILKRSAAGFEVSGCDERSRLDAKTERHFFDAPLSGEPQDFAGTLKKEMRAEDLFESEPYTDHRADVLFFSRVGKTFRITPLPRRLALLKLMQSAGKLQRFVDPTDRSRFLGMLSDFVATVSAYDVELSEDLSELDGLVRFLQDEAAVGRA
jgi:hypothetical protein